MSPHCRSYAAVRLDLQSPRLSFQLKIDTPVTPVLVNVYTDFVLCSASFCFRVWSAYGTERQTDAQNPQCGLVTIRTSAYNQY